MRILCGSKDQDHLTYEDDGLYVSLNEDELKKLSLRYEDELG